MRAHAAPVIAALSDRAGSMVGVIDIGSNSLRLVIYDRLSRAPQVLFNEKVMCALGRGLNATGRLNAAGVELAYENVERFVLLARRLGVGRLDALATSAVRDASDGAEFVAEIERRCQLSVTVIDGSREALLAAAGVRAGIPDAEGLAGDLGGGSLELAMAGPVPAADVISLPIGPLRLIAGTGDDTRPRAEIDAALDRVTFLAEGKGRPFYAVGGVWRALARVHMEHERYPLHIIQHYEIPRMDAEGFLTVIHRLSRKSLEKMIGISRRRLEYMPLAAYTLLRLVQRIEPSSVVFSVFGLREGHLFDLLPEAEQHADPLLIAAAQMAEANPRFGPADGDLLRWMAGLFPGEDIVDQRLYRAAALLSDIGWSEHPDYRAEHVFTRCLRMPAPGLDHHGRVFIAVALHARYGGNIDDGVMAGVRNLLDEASFLRARAIGLAFRVAYTLTGGAPGLLGETALVLEDGVITLSIPEHEAIETGEAVQRRLDALGRTQGCRTIVRRAGT